MTGQPAISLRGVGKTFGTHEALSGITFDIAPASFVSVVGPSGCGKSTLLSIVAGLTEASSGTVMVDGEVVRRPTPRKVAVVFQDALLLPWKTVIENIAFPLGIQGCPRSGGGGTKPADARACRPERVRITLPTPALRRDAATRVHR